MTDKQIIIDGVDVSFCPNHYNGWSRLHRDTRPMCECGYSRECSPREFECSYYVKCLEKKLQAKEQECEELKRALKEKTDEYNKLAVNYDAYANMANKQLDKLKAENESLKESFKLISATLNHHLQWEVDVYKRQIDSSVPDDWEYEEVLVLVEEYIEKLKQTLSEIKQLSDRIVNSDDLLLWDVYELNEQINQKISECEVKE